MRFPCEVTLRGALFYEPPRPGELAVVRHEPDNDHDPDACVVEVDGRPVGYLPAPLAARVVREHGPGTALSGAVSFVRDDGRLVRVLVHGPAGTAAAPTTSTSSAAAPAAPTATAAAPPPAAGPATAVPGAPAAAPQVGTKVRSASGRPLGVVVEVGDGDLVVDDGGARRRYPAAFVLVDAATPPEVG